MTKEELKNILNFSDIFPSDCEHILNYVNQLENNWNELKEQIEAYINENRNEMINTNSSIKGSLISAENDGYRKVLDKMQEIQERK